MTTPLPAMNEHARTALREAVDQAPLPAALRERVLRSQARRRAARRATPFVAMVLLALVMSSIDRPDREDLVDLQARSMALEATWQVDGDTAWLLADARAQPLLHRLREVDSAIAGLGPDGTDTPALERLWRERTQTLAALVDSRRQGGLAVQL